MRVRIQEVTASLVAAKQFSVHTATFYLFFNRIGWNVYIKRSKLLWKCYTLKNAA